MQIILKKMKLENFKGFKERTIVFSSRTKIKGMNGIGKSTIAGAWMWLFFNYSYDLVSNPTVRREVDGIPVDGDVSVEAVIDIDGKEVTARKVQIRSFKKDGSYSDDNKYFINEVPKTLRDFNEYFGFDMNLFLICSNVNRFMDLKAKEMREFVFDLVKDITNLDIAKQHNELSGLVSLLEQYTVEELKNMNSASKKKLKTELDEIDPKIDALQKLYVDVDFAEHELALSALKAQLAEVEDKLVDTSKSYDGINELKREIAGYKSKLQSIEQDERNTLLSTKRDIQTRLDNATYKLTKAMREKAILLDDIKATEEKITLNTETFNRLKTEYEKEKIKEYDASEDFCPECGSELSEEKKKASLDEFAKKRKNEMDKISVDGQRVRQLLITFKSNLETDKSKLIELDETITKLTADQITVKDELDALPTEANLLSNKEYTDLQSTIKALDFSLKETLESLTDTNTLKQELSSQKAEIQSQIESVQKLLGGAHTNARIDEQIAELKEKKRTLTQSVANCEKILNLIDELDKKKNELLVEEINKLFKIVKWILFEYTKGGEYKNVCIPTVDGYRFGVTTNEGREIQAKIDICQGIQMAKGIKCPIFLDRAESINDHNVPEMDCQMITLSVSDDVELRVEG